MIRKRNKLTTYYTIPEYDLDFTVARAELRKARENKNIGEIDNVIYSFCKKWDEYIKALNIDERKCYEKMIEKLVNEGDKSKKRIGSATRDRELSVTEKEGLDIIFPHEYLIPPMELHIKKSLWEALTSIFKNRL